MRLLPLYPIRFSSLVHYLVDGPDLRAFLFADGRREGVVSGRFRRHVAEVVWEPPSDDGSLPSSA
jgi:hypothetical protein